MCNPARADGVSPSSRREQADLVGPKPRVIRSERVRDRGSPARAPRIRGADRASSAADWRYRTTASRSQARRRHQLR